MEYTRPTLELIVLETEDVITASGDGPLNPQPGDPNEELEF